MIRRRSPWSCAVESEGCWCMHHHPNTSHHEQATPRTSQPSSPIRTRIRYGARAKHAPRPPMRTHLTSQIWQEHYGENRRTTDHRHTKCHRGMGHGHERTALDAAALPARTSLHRAFLDYISQSPRIKHPASIRTEISQSHSTVSRYEPNRDTPIKG